MHLNSNPTDIASQFDELSEQSWIANAYILGNTAFIPIYGQVADIFGRHGVMQSAIFIFLVGSALCTGAQAWGMLLAGRAIAGIGGISHSQIQTYHAAAGCFTMTKIIMSDTNSLRDNSTQNTFLAIMYAVAYSIGPVCTLNDISLIFRLSVESSHLSHGGGVSL
jgi:MFS family permease